MSCARLALRLAAGLDRCGAHEALVGDLLEEFSTGRSRWWFAMQVVGLCGVALVARVRNQRRLTSALIGLAPSATLLAGVAIAPRGMVLELWAGIYIVAGVLSLFGHLLASSTLDSRALVLPVD